MNILLAEDDPYNRDMLIRRLRRRGHVVDAAENGRAAIDLARGKQFDTVLMDLDMPEVDGWQAMEALRDMGLSTLPLLILSAHSLREDRARAASLGVAGYFTKPLDFDALDARLRLLAEKMVLRNDETLPT